jgi:hypothetical protein
LSTQDLNDLVELTTRLLEHVEGRIGEEKVKVLEVVRRMPLSEVLAAKEARPAFRGDADPFKNRSPY